MIDKIVYKKLFLYSFIIVFWLLSIYISVFFYKLHFEVNFIKLAVDINLLNKIKRNIMIYRENNGYYPENLSSIRKYDFIEVEGIVPSNSWGHDYNYNKERDDFKLVSCPGNIIT